MAPATRWRQRALIVLGLALFVGGGAVLAVEPAWAKSPTGVGAALIAGGLTLVIVTVGRRRRERRDEVVVDERVGVIDEKAGNRAFQASFAAQGVLFALVSFTVVDLPLSTVLGGLFVFTALSHLVASNVYRRGM